MLLLIGSNLGIVFKNSPSLFGSVVVSTVNAFAVGIARDSSLETLTVLLQAFALFAVAPLGVPRLVEVAIILRNVVICLPVRSHRILILPLKLILIVQFHAAILKLASILPW